MTSTPWLASGYAADEQCRDLVGFEPFIEQFAEHPTVAGVADAVEHGPSDRDVVGLVCRSGPHESW